VEEPFPSVRLAFREGFPDGHWRSSTRDPPARPDSAAKATPGCPSHVAFLPRLRALLGQAGVDAPVRELRVESDEHARRERFLGSPTLRVDGIDIDPGVAERTDYGLKCRLYRGERGLGGVPPDDWVIAALRGAR
jgi:hypothetical protein